MNVSEAIRTRRSIRVYKAQEVPEELVKELLEAGTWAPSAVNLQPWYFVAVRSGQQMNRLLEIMGQVSIDIEPSLQERFPRHPAVVEETTKFIRNLGGAPVCILAFCQNQETSKTKETIIQSVAAALENIALEAVEQGLGSCWLTAPYETGMGDRLRDEFAPGKGTLVAVMTVGYPAQEPAAPRRREGRYIIV